MRKILILGCLFIGLSFSVIAQNMQMGTTTALWEKPITADFADAKENGIEYVEVALNQYYRNVSEDEVIPRINALKAKIDSAGMKVWSIHLPFSRTLDISVIDDEARKRSVDIIARMIKASAIFNPSKLVLHSSSEPIDDSIREQRISNAIESIGFLRKYAEEIEAQLCVENLPRTCLGNTPEELLRIIADYPEVGICFDTNHYLTGTPIHFAKIAGHRIGTLHISDYDGVNESHWIPGDGTIPWCELLDIIRDKGYKGIYMYEALKSKDGVRATAKQLANSFELLKKDE
ncbi:sugar phosphate isomerase/epimerase family protein [Dysgonomonas termitidis]|uniref:Sugar phosphate isomerase/epimerase family protein n=1 Tax=Dysgonomonas termitidis TaxID=1516126 RepID=A0ABV9L3Q3_9BACT